MPPGAAEGGDPFGPLDSVLSTVAALFSPSLVLPEQWQTPRFICGEQRLMLAILEDALRCLRLGHPASTRKARLYTEAHEWITRRDAQWPFSFENICTMLDLDAGYIRKQLNCQRDGYLARRDPSQRGPSRPVIRRRLL